MKKNATMELLNGIKIFDKAVYKFGGGYFLDYETYGRLLDYILDPTPQRCESVISHLTAIYQKEFARDEQKELFHDFMSIYKLLENMI